jgi:hypothetical protein
MDDSGRKYLARAVTAVAPGLAPTAHTASLYDYAVTLFAVADEATSRLIDGTREDACCRLRNYVFKVSVPFLGCCTSLLSLDTITTRDYTKPTASSCTLRESLSPLREAVNNPSF